MCGALTNGGITSGGGMSVFDFTLEFKIINKKQKMIGFSVYYDLPDWQADAVNNYLANPNVNLPPSSAGF